MKVIIRSKTLEVTKALQAFIKKQAQKLTKSGQRISKITVFLETVRRKKNDSSAATVKFHVDIPGKNIVVKRQAEDMYKAVVDAANRANRYMRKTKERRLTKKRGNHQHDYSLPVGAKFSPQL